MSSAIFDGFTFSIFELFLNPNAKNAKIALNWQIPKIWNRQTSFYIVIAYN